jgi:hypothetical protein
MLSVNALGYLREDISQAHSDDTHLSRWTAELLPAAHAVAGSKHVLVKYPD